MKLQPNFSWQKYEDNEENQQEQFQYQLQREHIETANSINSTIDDESFFTRQRMTSFTWVNNKPIWTVTLPLGTWVGGTVNTIATGITGKFTVIKMVSCISDGSLSTSNTLLLPNIDVSVAANEISINRAGTNIVITSGGTNRAAFKGYVTVYFIMN